MLLLDLMGEEDLAHVSIGPFVSRGLSLAPTGALCAIVRYYICICHFLNFLWTHWDWLMLIDADWCWLMLIDMLIDADWYVDWCLLTWFFLIDDQLRFNQVFFCQSVHLEFLRSFIHFYIGGCPHITSASGEVKGVKPNSDDCWPRGVEPEKNS